MSLAVSVDVKQRIGHSLSLICHPTSEDIKLYIIIFFGQSSAAVWKSRWPSSAPVPNKPTVSVDVKQHFNINSVWQPLPETEINRFTEHSNVQASKAYVSSTVI